VKVGEAFRVALEGLRANRLRSALTMLGVIIGVGAVVVLVAIGSGAKQEVEEQVEGLGSNLILVLPGRFEFGSAPSVSRLELADVELLERVVGSRRSVATTVSSGEAVRVGGREVFATLNGTNESSPYVFDRPLARGQYFRATDVDTRRRVAVLGSNIARALFGDVDPLGRQVSIGGVRFRVLGVFAETGTTFGVSRDDEVHIPVTAAQRLLGVDTIDGMAVKAPSTEGIDRLRRSLVAALEEKYPGEEFSAVTQTQILGTIGRILGLLTGVLAAIAGISLLVGGVGVSNIMLVSVRERTREIGLRKALGARQRDILLQFLIEAVLLCVIGGVVGIGIGVGVSVAVSAISPLPAVIQWWSPVLAFGVSAGVGIFFGVAPARRAGRLDPVEALRAD
jgi:putative ABC transport system permease protein